MVEAIGRGGKSILSPIFRPVSRVSMKKDDMYDTFSPISKNLLEIFKRFPRWCSAAVISGNSRDGEIVRGIRERIETRGFNEACNERVEHGPRNPFFVGAAR